MRLFFALLGIAAWVFLGASAYAQPRVPADRMRQPLLDDITAAVLERINVDQNAAREARFPGRAFGKFDRNRNGAFFTRAALWGVPDLLLAIEQFVHDNVDLDGDGVNGFYELECERAAAGVRLNPSDATTTPGTQDGAVDCDGDGLANAVEQEYGMNPVDPNDLDGDLDHDGVSNGDEIEAGTNLRPVLYLERFEPGEDGKVGVRVMMRQDDADLQPVLVEMYIAYDRRQVSYDRTNIGGAAAAAGKNIFAVLVRDDNRNPIQVRFTLTSFRPSNVETGELAQIIFDVERAGPTEFTFDIETSRLSPPEAREAQTFGHGHPDEPLRMELNQ